MKSCILFILFLTLTIRAYATHVTGGELRYEYTGTGNAYRIELILAFDCQGAGFSTPPTNDILVRSSCSSTQISLPITLYKVDTLEAYCPGAGGLCGGVNPLPGQIRRHYFANVNLTPCNAWKISYTLASRSNNIANITTPNLSNIYLEAFLNNSTAQNSSPLYASKPSVFATINAVTRTPLQIIDGDNDSINTQMIAPVKDSFFTNAFLSGITVANPFGAGSYTQIGGNGNLKYVDIYSATSGFYTVSSKISEYRNGVLVGYSMREWSLRIHALYQIHPPMPVAGSTLYTEACAGGSNSIGLHFTSHDPADSVFLQVVPQNAFTYNINYAPGLGGSIANISWTNPATLNPATTPYFLLKVRAWDNNCPVPGEAWYTIYVKVGACNIDSVWPGDVNKDKIVDIYDPLDMAVAMGSTGAARTGANMLWQPQACNAWTGNFFNGTNLKHADGDGNGTVALADTTAISNNYSLTHNKGNEEPQYKGTAIPDLYFDHTGVFAYPGANVSVRVMLGNSTQPMGRILGLAGNVRIANITPTNLSMGFPVSWIGTPAATLRFTKNSGTNTVDWACARTDHFNASGSGQIATLSLGIPSSAPLGSKIILMMERIKIIDSAGIEITGYNNIYDTLTIVTVGVAGVRNNSFEAAIVPNPSFKEAQLHLSLEKAMPVQVLITDITGRIMWNQKLSGIKGVQEMHLPAILSSGVYFVRISDGNSTETVKWVKGD